MGKKKPELQVGQTIYVEWIGRLSKNEPKEPTPYLKGRKAHSFRCGMDSPKIIK